MSFDKCLASLKPLAQKEAERGYRKQDMLRLFGTTQVVLPLGFDRQEFFSKSAEATHGMSISGVQEKLSLKLDRKTGTLEPTTEGGEYILKPSPEAFPHAAENEHTAMLASKLLGIETAECTLVAFKSGELAYLTRRFDRLGPDEKVHQEDLLQIADRPARDKYRISYESAGELVDNATGGKQAAKLDLFRRILFAYATGNNDLHMKNISLHRLPDNQTDYFDKLTPNYDVLFVQAFVNAKHGEFMACDLLTDPENGEEQFSEHYQHYGFYTGHDFLELGRRYGLPTKVAEKALHTQTSRQYDLLALIETSYMPDTMKQEATVLVRERSKGLTIGVDR